MLLVFAGFAVLGAPFSGPWWNGHSGWGFPWGLAFIGLLIWWLVTRSGNSPDAYHQATALAGSLAAIGLLMVVLGVAGWRAGFTTFLAVVLALASWSMMVVPPGIHLGGRIGDATWAPTSVSSNADYHIGIGEGLLDLSELPGIGLSEARIPASVGIGDLKVIVPEGLTVRIVGHVGLGEILLPGDIQNVAGNGGKSGTDVSRSVVVGDGPTEVVVDAEVGVGQLTVVKE